MTTSRDKAAATKRQRRATRQAAGKRKRSTPRYVQACITAITFPDDVDKLDGMIAKNAGLTNAITDIDCLLNFRPGIGLTWTAPRWMSAGDLLFFYHTRSARPNIRSLRRIVEETAPANDDLWPVIALAEEQARLYCQTIFACALISGRAAYQPQGDGTWHFRSTIFAPLGRIHVFPRPLPASIFQPHVTLSPGATLTPLHGRSLTHLKSMLGSNNVLPRFIANAVPGSAGFRHVTAANWMSIVTQPRCRFIDESQLRAYLVDFLLEDLRDARTRVHAECDCFRHGHRTGVADYFVRVHGIWMPVEVKLSIRAEAHLNEQLYKYHGTEEFVPRRGPWHGRHVAAGPSRVGLVVDEWGIYLSYRGKLLGRGTNQPIWPRQGLGKGTTQEIRARVAQVRSNADSSVT